MISVETVSPAAWSEEMAMRTVKENETKSFIGRFGIVKEKEAWLSAPMRRPSSEEGWSVTDHDEVWYAIIDAKERDFLTVWNSNVANV